MTPIEVIRNSWLWLVKKKLENTQFWTFKWHRTKSTVGRSLRSMRLKVMGTRKIGTRVGDAAFSCAHYFQAYAWDSRNCILYRLKLIWFFQFASTKTNLTHYSARRSFEGQKRENSSCRSKSFCGAAFLSHKFAALEPKIFFINIGDRQYSWSHHLISIGTLAD